MSNVSSRQSAVASERYRLSHSQNYISEPMLVPKLLSHVELGSIDTIIEIGPGKGALTFELTQLAPQVLAIEADPKLVLALVRRFATCHPAIIVYGDFLDFPLPARPFVVVANIPFNRTAEIVRKLTDEQSGLQAAYLIMQKEAAIKFSDQSHGQASLLSYFLQLEYEVSVLCHVPRSSFSPRPRVDAAFALFRKRKIPLLSIEEARQYKDLLSYLFPRGPLFSNALRQVFTSKQLKRLLRDLDLHNSTKLREVSFTAWLGIYQVFAEYALPTARSKIQGSYMKLEAEQAALHKHYRTSRH